MHNSRYLVLVALTLIGSNVVLATEVESDEMKLNSARLLRAAKNTEVDSTSPEERGIAADISTHVSEGLSKWGHNIKMTTKRSDASIKKALGIDKGLTGAALKAHPKFSEYEALKIERWLKKDTPTSTVWEKLKLDQVPLKGITKADGYSTYSKYVEALNDQVKTYLRSQHALKLPKIAPGGTANEQAAKRLILSKLNVDDPVATQVMLGLWKIR